MSNPNRDNRSLHIFLILGVIPVIWAALMVAPFISEGMLANSEYLVMLNQAPTDRAELAKLLNISDTQLSYITNVGFGKGLLKCGSSIVPFVDNFPKDTKLYRLMSTKPGEIQERLPLTLPKGSSYSLRRRSLLDCRFSFCSKAALAQALRRS